MYVLYGTKYVLVLYSFQRFFFFLDRKFSKISAPANDNVQSIFGTFQEFKVEA